MVNAKSDNPIVTDLTVLYGSKLPEIDTSSFMTLTWYDDNDPATTKITDPASLTLTQRTILYLTQTERYKDESDRVLVNISVRLPTLTYSGQMKVKKGTKVGEITGSKFGSYIDGALLKFYNLAPETVLQSNMYEVQQVLPDYVESNWLSLMVEVLEAAAYEAWALAASELDGYIEKALRGVNTDFVGVVEREGVKNSGGLYKTQGSTSLTVMTNLWGKQPLYFGNYWKTTPGFNSNGMLKQLNGSIVSGALNGSGQQGEFTKEDLAAGKTLVYMGKNDSGVNSWKCVQHSEAEYNALEGSRVVPEGEWEKRLFIQSLSLVGEQLSNESVWSKEVSDSGTTVPNPFENFTGFNQLDGNYYEAGFMVAGYTKATVGGVTYYLLNGGKVTGLWEGSGVEGNFVCDEGLLLDGVYDAKKFIDGDDKLYKGGKVLAGQGYWLVDKGKMVDVNYYPSRVVYGEDGSRVLKKVFPAFTPSDFFNAVIRIKVFSTSSMQPDIFTNLDGSGGFVLLRPKESYYDNGVLSTGVAAVNDVYNLFVDGYKPSGLVLYDQTLYNDGVQSIGHVVYRDVHYKDGKQNSGKHVMGGILYNNGFVSSGYDFSNNNENGGVSTLFKDGKKYTGAYTLNSVKSYYINGLKDPSAADVYKLQLDGCLYMGGDLASGKIELNGVLYDGGERSKEEFDTTKDYVDLTTYKKVTAAKDMFYYYSNKFTGEHNNLNIPAVRSIYENGLLKEKSERVPTTRTDEDIRFVFGSGSGMYLYRDGEAYTGVYSYPLDIDEYGLKYNYVNGRMPSRFSRAVSGGKLLLFYDGKAFTGDHTTTVSDKGEQSDTTYPELVLNGNRVSYINGVAQDKSILKFEVNAGRMRVTEMIPEADNEVASKKYVDSSINNLVGGASESLDTLREIALSLNDNVDMAGTLINKVSGVERSLIAERDRANIADESLKTLITEEMKRAQETDRLLDVALSEERERALGAEKKVSELVVEERERVHDLIKELDENKFPASVSAEPKYSVHVPTGNLQIPKNAYLMVGTRWRLSANTEHDEDRRFVFEYMDVVSPEHWVTAVPFIAAQQGGEL